MGQIAPPNSDIAVGNWAPAPLFPNIDALFFTDDSTYVATTQLTGDAFTVALRPIAYPSAGSQVLFVRACNTSAESLTMTVLLLQSGAGIAIRTIALASSFQTAQLQLTATEMATITDYSKLQVTVIVGMPLTCDCAQLAAGAAQYFTVELSGMSNGTCMDCALLNEQTAVLIYQGNCVWVGSAFYCGSNKPAAWSFAYDQPHNQWLLQFNTGEAKWTAPAAGWNGKTPLTLTLTYVGDVPNCKGYPDQITITPIGIPGSSSSSSSSSGGNQVEVSWIQFQTPNHCPGVPADPGNPLFGQAGGCDCAVPQCGGGGAIPGLGGVGGFLGGLGGALSGGLGGIGSPFGLLGGVLGMGGRPNDPAQGPIPGPGLDGGAPGNAGGLLGGLGGALGGIAGGLRGAFGALGGGVGGALGGLPALGGAGAGLGAAMAGGCGCAQPGAPPAGPRVPNMAPFPIRYSNGEIVLSAADVHTDGMGFPWGQRRSFASRLKSEENPGAGFNWQVREWPYLVRQDDGPVIIMGQANDALWFDPDYPDNPRTYTPRYGVRRTLTLDRANLRYCLTDLDGSVTEFDAGSGIFLQHCDPARTAITPGQRLLNGFNFTDLERTISANGVTTKETFSYAYDDVDANYPLLTQVSLERTSGGVTTSVTRTLYTYYAAGDAFGSAGDLRTAETQTYESHAWVSTGTTLYRYWLGGPSSSSSSSSSSSFGGGPGGPHALKYVVRPSSYDRLVADGYSPLTAPDAAVAPYADHYFEYYHHDGRVATEAVDGASRTFHYAYSESANDNGFNKWATKTIETRPDGSLNILYCNYAGQVMLRVLQAGADQWCDYYQYDDSTGDLLLHAMPSAVIGFEERFADLVDGGAYLHTDSGLIRLYEYHAPTGYLAQESIANGTAATPILLRQYEYVQGAGPSSSSSWSSSAPGPLCTCPAQPVYFLSAEILYPDDGQSSSSSSSSSSSCAGLRQIITSYSYIWYAGGNRVQQRITTLPVISTDQNGSGVANSRRDYYDLFGNNTWHMDERGFLTRTSYDVPTAGVTQRIDDVDTAQVTDAPPGWSTPAGGGLHLITDMPVDPEGRNTQRLGPTHTIDIGGVPTTIRRAGWTVYQDGTHQVWTAMGYATGSAPHYTFTLVNPVSIRISDASGRPLQQIQATRDSTSGPLDPSDAFAQSSYTRWSVTQYGNDNLPAAHLAYKLIPASGSGTVGTNYDQTAVGYDVMKRPNRQVTGGGTVARTVFDVRGNPESLWVGTNDAGATDSDPSGGGAAGNNMVVVTSNEYDSGSVGGDNNLTQTTQHVDGSTTRVTEFLFDWRNRRTKINGEVNFYKREYFDNLDRVYRAEHYNASISGTLIARNDIHFDDLNRASQEIRYAVDPSTGVVGNSLRDNTWYDRAGNLLMQIQGGAKLFSKIARDSLNRATALYQGYSLAAPIYSDPVIVSSDTLLTQAEVMFDAAGNAIQTITRKRYHIATGTGALGSPTSAQPQARVEYLAAYPDALGRTIALAAYGTNGGTSLDRSATIPARGGSMLVKTCNFDIAGDLRTVTDAAGTLLCLTYDNLSRLVEEILNCTAASSSSSSSSSSSGSSAPCPPSMDTNITHLTSYNADGNVASTKIINTMTGTQTTQYVYGTTLSDSSIASSLLKRYDVFPDSSSGSDQVAFTYNRQGELVTRADQNGTVHEFDYDLLGRRIEDRVTTLGEGVDGTVRRMSTDYEVRGMIASVTSYDNAAVGAGNIVNQVSEVYNGFCQLIAEYQSDTGPVVIDTTPLVQYSYADGSANTIRPVAITYPNGRVLNFDYGAPDNNEDSASRVASLIDNDGITHLVDYSYLGLASIITATSPQPGLAYTLVGIDGGNDPVTGDIYHGLDTFSRIKDLIWLAGGGSSSSSSSSSGTVNIVERIQHAYDPVGNRQYRAELTDPTDRHDEIYNYDGAYRLKELQRGTLNAARTALFPTTLQQCWTLDESGNWSTFRDGQSGDGIWDFIQYRTSNPANEITLVTEELGPAWATPAYDHLGNMTLIPQPTSPTQNYSGTFDAWNRLVRLTAAGVTIATYSYDGFHRRQLSNTYTAGAISETRHTFFSNQWQVLEERLGVSSSAERQFVWGFRFTDDLVLRDRDANATGVLSQRIYTLQDANTNVTALATVAGLIVERYCYSAYGLATVLSGDFAERDATEYSWEHCYACYRLDLHSGLYDVRSRCYQPGLGAFIQRDLVGYASGDYNLYRYVINNGINSVDPYGHGAVEVVLSLLAVAVAGCILGVVGALALQAIQAQPGNPFLPAPFVGPPPALNVITFCNAYTGCILGAGIMRTLALGVGPQWLVVIPVGIFLSWIVSRVVCFLCAQICGGGARVFPPNVAGQFNWLAIIGC
jgi:RHS repeat-associated protein